MYKRQFVYIHFVFDFIHQSALTCLCYIYLLV